MENPLPEQMPTRPPLPRNLIIILGIIAVGAIAFTFYLYQNKKQLPNLPGVKPSPTLTQSKSISGYKVTAGTITAINPKSITIKEVSGQIVNVLIDQLPTVNQQIISIPTHSIPTQKQVSSGSAQLLYTIVSTVSTSKINFSDIKVGYQAKITLSAKDGKYYAQTITVIKEQSK